MANPVTAEELYDLAPSRHSFAAWIAENQTLLTFLNYYCLFDPLSDVIPDDTDAYRRKASLAESIEALASIALDSMDLVAFHKLNGTITNEARQIFKHDLAGAHDIDRIQEVFPVTKEQMLGLDNRGNL